MKCAACGCERKNGFRRLRLCVPDNSAYGEEFGDRQVQIQLTTLKSTLRYFETIFVCPKCGTLKIRAEDEPDII